MKVANCKCLRHDADGMGSRKHFIFALLVGFATPAWADECVDPYQRTVVSGAKTFVVEFTPKKRDCSNNRCGDNPKETGELKGDPRARTLALFSVDRRGRKKQIWTKLLAENMEPMGMAVADDGRHVILADTAWCDSGIGDNVLVLLGPSGEQLQNWSLEQLLPADYVEALPQSSPNIHWRGGISYDARAKGFVFQVAIANGKRFDIDATTFVLDPADRSFLPQDKPVWDAALSYAREVVRNRCVMRQWRLRREAVPLSAPTGTDRTIWQNFAKEIEERIEFPKDGYVFTWQLFLSAPGDASYQEDLKDFKRLSTILGRNADRIFIWCRQT